MSFAAVPANHGLDDHRAEVECKRLYTFVIACIASSVVLLFTDSLSVRLLCRLTPFGMSLWLFVNMPRGVKHPATMWLALATAIISVQIIHPSTFSVLVGVAQVGLFFAILSPCFWASRLPLTVERFERLVLLYWCFHLLSATVGILQVYFPGTFQPNLSSVIAEMYGDKAESLKITLADGTRVFRPFGLTDHPGGASMAGLWSCVFGAAYAIFGRRAKIRGLGWLSMLIGFAAIYFTYVRSVFLMAIICIGTLGAVLLRRGELERFTKVAIGAPLILTLGFMWASFVGGENLASRFTSLTEQRIDEVYYSNRGRFLEYTINELLPRYPVGAGLGRWGMMRYYFGRFGGNYVPPIHVEIQLTGWLLDGGIPLIFAYSIALAVTIAFAYQIALRVNLGRLSEWAALVVAFDLACLAVTFNYPLFIGQSGMDFWTLNGALFATVVHEGKRRAFATRAAANEASPPPHQPVALT